MATLRFITCGSVDDGKSTLIGCLLHRSGSIRDDQLRALEVDSRRMGTRNGAIDYALALDGLVAEREQGITIDVAYRYFATDRRTFIVADTPGHEQYTRNMITGASTADAAVVLVDVRKGVQPQTRRHSYLASLVGIRHLALAVNKMDLVDYSRVAFERVAADYRSFVGKLGIDDVVVIPTCAVQGGNVVERGEEMSWYDGPSLLQFLEAVDIGESQSLSRPFRMPVQWVNRPHADFRGFAGTIVAGLLRPGDRVCVEPSGTETTVERIVTRDGDLGIAYPDQSVTVTLRDDIDVSRGDVLVAATARLEVADHLEATIFWLDDQPMLRGRSYLMKIGSLTVGATISPLKYRINPDTFEHVAAVHLELNDIGVAQLQLDRPIPFEPYGSSRDLGGFILMDRLSYATVGAGILHFALRRSHNVHWQANGVDKATRAGLKGQKPCIIWFTGLSGAGKSTISNRLEQRLNALGLHTYLLDGDNIRHGLNRDLGFTDADRVENIRRAAEVAKLMVDAGLIVLAAFISPFRSERDMARALFEPDEFVEVFVNTPLAVAEGRDTKGLYRKARLGALRNFTGIDSPYEPPENPDIDLDTQGQTPDATVDRVMSALRDLGVIG